MMLWNPTTYEAGPGLAELGGDRTVYRLAPGSDDDVQRVATALGISGEIVREGQSRRIPAGDGALESWDGAWFSYWSGRAIEGSVGVACSPDGVCEEAPPPERPADLPTSEQARSMAMAVFEAAGLSLDGADITVDDGVTTWFVHVRYRVDGMLVDGLDGYASVNGQGIVDASGPLGTLEVVGPYATISAVEAIDRLNEGFGIMPMMREGGAVDLGAPDVAEPPPAATAGEASEVEPQDGVPETKITDTPEEPTGAPAEEPWTEPEPVVVTLTGVEWGLTTFWSWDGSGIYLLPAYGYTAEGVDYQPIIPAVTDDVIAPPPPTTEPDRPVDDGGTVIVDPVEPGGTDGASGGGAGGSTGAG